jgi:ubiquinone/menaquinone biosynthesis C-methylase UbiE
MDHTKTATHWDTQHFNKTFLRAEWSFHPFAKARLHQLLEAPSRENWFHDRYLKGRSGMKALGIGVGKAETEINLMGLGGFARYDLFDVSSVALAHGRKSANEHGLSRVTNFICGDIHSADLPSGSYDVITFIASLHHMENLNEILLTCDRLLAPDGLIWAAEYIGPDFFQFPDADTAFAKALYRALDPAILRAGEPELKFPSRADVIEVDPTESVHSSEIEKAMRTIWPDLDFIGTYGTLIFIISWCMDHDAWYDTDKGREAFQTILDIDSAMIDAGRLPHYFAYLIARKPKSALQPLSLGSRLDAITRNLFKNIPRGKSA